MNVLGSVLERVDRDLDASVDRLFSFLRIESISTDPAFATHCQAAARFVADDLATIGFTSEIRPTGGHPIVVAKSPAAADSSTPRVLFYGHYDVQPVDPLNLWDHPPFDPHIAELPGGRKIIVARGACDDKGQVMTFVEACRAFKAVTGVLPVPLTLIVEGEEECGSKHMTGFLKDNAAEFSLDMALVCDTTMWDADTPAVTTSLRGLLYEEVTLRCADRDLHSGLFGGAAQNPIRVLARVIAAIHDDNGHITIPGFYDGVADLPEDVRTDLMALDLTPEKFLGQVGLKVPAGETGRMLIEQISTRPTCDVNGITGGYTGEGAKTVIASEARAKISFRLVQGQDPEKIRTAFRAFVQARLPADCTATFSGHSATPAIQLPFDSPALTRIRAALKDEWGRKAVLLGSGASIPIVGDFKKMLGLDAFLVGFGLDDDRIHSPNEKYDLKSFHKGIRSWVRILASLAQPHA